MYGVLVSLESSIPLLPIGQANIGIAGMSAKEKKKAKKAKKGQVVEEPPPEPEPEPEPEPVVEEPPPPPAAPEEPAEDPWGFGKSEHAQ